MKHDPMLDEAGLLSDPYNAEEDCDTEDHEEMELICEGWDVEVDRDIETITMYLWGGLTRNQSIATYHRLVRDRRFREKAHPYIEECCGVSLAETPRSQVRAALQRVHEIACEQGHAPTMRRSA